MPIFRIGDRVRFVKQIGELTDNFPTLGLTGTVIHIHTDLQFNISLKLDEHGHDIIRFISNELELLNPETEALRHRAQIAWQRGDYNL